MFEDGKKAGPALAGGLRQGGKIQDETQKD
jgi:hypothetical protein